MTARVSAAVNPGMSAADAQVARRAVMDYLAREEPSLKQPALPLMRSIPARAEGQGR